MKNTPKKLYSSERSEVIKLPIKKQRQKVYTCLALSFFLNTSSICYATFNFLEELRNTKETHLSLKFKYIRDEGAIALANNTSITSLNLERNSIGDEGAKALANNKNITSLNLEYNSIGDKGAKALAKNTNITSLNLGHNSIGDEGAKALANNTNITSLGLNSNGIGDEGAIALANNTSITSLGLRSNKIGNEGAKALANNTNITSLDLRSNKIGVEGAKALANNINITSLDLMGNSIGDEGAKALANNTNITSLNLEFNSIRDEGAKALANNTNITSLNLDFNSIGDEGAKALANNANITSLVLSSNSIGEEGVITLANNANITSLNLGHNSIKDDGVITLANNTNITSLVLSDNYIGNEGAKILANNTNIISLDLGGNKIGNEGAKALANNKNITSLNLMRNSIEDEGAKALFNALKTQTNLTSLIFLFPSSIDQNEVKQLLNRNKVLAESRSQVSESPLSPVMATSATHSTQPTQTLALEETKVQNNQLREQLQKLTEEKSHLEETVSLVIQQQINTANSYLKIFDVLQEAAADDNPLIHIALGLSHKLQVVPTPEPALALHHFTRALEQGEMRAFPLIQDFAEQGNKEAQYLIGQAYEQGQGIEGDLQQAISWYKKAAAQEHELAQQRLTVLFYSDLESLAEQGDRQAQFKLAQAYLKDTTFPQYLQKSIFWLTKAAEQDQPEALVMLANFYYRGYGVNPSVNEAIKLYQKAVFLNQEEAFKALQTLAHQDIPDAQYALAQTYEQRQENDLALKWYKAAAPKKPRALFDIGRLQEEGRGISFTSGREIVEAYRRALLSYTQAYQKGVFEAAEAMSHTQRTIRSLEAIREPEIKRNLLLRKLLSSSSLAPDLLYYSAHLTGVMRLAFTEGPQEALMQALHGIAQFPKNSHYARAIIEVLLKLTDDDEFHSNALGENEDAFRLSELGRICQGIYSIQNPTDFIKPSELPLRLNVSSSGLKDIRIEVFNCLFKTPSLSCDWDAFNQTVERILGQFDQGVSLGKITQDMLYDDEFDEQADRGTLRDLLKGGKVVHPSERFAQRMIKIEPLLMYKLDENSRYAQLASWAIAGIHCSTRAEKETYDFYYHHMTDTQSMEQEDASLKMRLALTLADFRKALVSELVPMDESERIHQIAHLEKKASQSLALVGDAQAFEDSYQFVVKSCYKNMTPVSILEAVKRKYTPQGIAEYVAKEVNKGSRLSRLPYSVLYKEFEQSQALDKLSEFYDEDMATFTLEGAKALLYSTGYLERM